MLLVLWGTGGQKSNAQADGNANAGQAAQPGQGPDTDVIQVDTGSGSIDNELIRDSIREHRDEVRYCYEKGLADAPRVEGRITIEFRIDGSGAVLSAITKDSSLTN